MSPTRPSADLQLPAGFTVHSTPDELRVNLMPDTYVREIAAQPGGWNTLKVAIDGDCAHFFVNGARAGSVEYQPAMGGGMVGLYASFGGRQSVWQFSELVVLA